MKQKRLRIILLAIALLLGCTGRGQRATVSEERLLGVWEVESEGKNPDYLEFCGDGKARFAQEPYGAPLNTYLPYTIDADTVSFISGAIEKAVYDAESDRLSITLRDGEVKAAKRTEGINPYFTCTGTEYGPYPIIPYEQRQEEAKTFLNENRDTLERAAQVAVETGELTEIQYHLYHLTGSGMNAEVSNPEPEFVEDAANYLVFYYPLAIDETWHNPGILYFVALIYTTNTEEQISEFYRYDIKPLDGNWFIETYFYAY